MPHVDTPVKPVHILLVEDNPADVDLTREALQEGKLRVNLTVLGDGEAALDYLYQRGEHVGAPLPDLILLDMNLPRLDGIGVLQAIKNDPHLCMLPVVVLTTSQAYDSIMKSYQLHANCFITKPVDLEQFYHVIKSIEQFWFTVVKLPTGRVECD